MSDNEKIENARLAREAQDAVASRPPSGGAGVLAALKRYLTSEQYRKQSRRSTGK
jgi:hypothetical protein